MTALTPTQQANLLFPLTGTAFGRLAQSEITAILTAMSNAGYTVQAIGSTGGSYISSPGEFEQLVVLLRSSSPASRLSHTEVFQALQTFVLLEYPILRPSSLGVS